MIYSRQINQTLRLINALLYAKTDKVGVPYVFHPYHLAEQMETEEEVLVALLHDVLEDTHVTEEDLRSLRYSWRVIAAVKLLTHAPEQEYMEYIMNLSLNPLARKVKIADLRHNMDKSRYAGDNGSYYRDGMPKRMKKYEVALKFLTELDKILGRQQNILSERR